METGRIDTKTFLIVISSIAVIEGSAIFLLSGTGVNPLLITGIIRLLEISLILAAVMICRRGLTSIGLEISTVARGFKKGLIWSAIFGLAAGFVFMILRFSGIDPLTLIHTQVPGNFDGMILFMSVGCIIGPVAEELFFRGILYGFFRRWGIAAALISTTIIFILAHHNTGTIPVTQAVGGIIFAVAYEIENSLMVPIIIHILGNTAIFLLPIIF